MKARYILIFCSALFLSFILKDDERTKTEIYYEKHKGNNEPSKSIAPTGNGKLVNGKLFPFSGKNYRFFSEWSYLQGRAYTHSKVRKTVLETYEKLDKLYPGRMFGLMESSLEKGGKLWPHNTHQNGLSVDFMTPLLKDKKPYYKLDDMGIQHYGMEFNENGFYEKDKTVSIDFNLIAHHILLLNECAGKNGLKIKKVIWMIELKDELFATEKGKVLKKSGIYFAQALTNYVNTFHDEHFHVDFEPAN